ncbi:MAG: metalloregulator ArsR/SmtB family transcription factor [Sphingobium sp.]|nr:helix-turn-helix transcriptional regulator [Sphingobium sp.]MCP5397887.1 helix-turn-helix transcriptional regulator [Sphingomonas sp.]
MAALYQSRDLADSAVEKLRVYAQPQRLMILSCLLHGERTVSDIDAATAIGQPALSQQLAELRRAELVRTRRESKQIFYSLADETTALCVRAMEAILGGDGDPAVRLGEILEDSAPDSARLNRPSGAASFARIG